MLTKEQIEGRGINITPSICDYCSIAHPEWQKELFEVTRSIDPRYERTNGYPGDHPIWEALIKASEKYYVPCLQFSYDDCEIDICVEHLKEIVSILEKE